MAESFFGSLKKERIKKHIYNTRELAIADISDYIESFYNPIRRHSHLGGMSPDQFERLTSLGGEVSTETWELHNLSDEQRQGPWTPEFVEPRVKVFSQIRSAVEPTYNLVAAAVEREVGIRNERVLRYSAPPAIWEAGCTLDSWVTSLRSEMPTPAAPVTG